MIMQPQQTRPRRPAVREMARAPAGTRIYAIGDVHGRRDLLDQVLARIKQDASATDAPARKVLVLLGDLIDRGPDSRGVVERAAQLLDGEILSDFEVHVLKGNHEDMMLRFLAGRESGEAWRSNGGDATLDSYGLDPFTDERSLAQRLLAKLPDRHKRVLRDMELSHREGGYGFVHAGVKPGVAWDNQADQDRLWIRKEFTESIADFDCVVVHGHTATSDPVVNANRIGIDTRAWASGRLTCLVLEDDGRRFITS